MTQAERRFVFLKHCFVLLVLDLVISIYCVDDRDPEFFTS